MSESRMHLALATIETASGRRWIYYNGPGRQLTVESDDGSAVDRLDAVAVSIDEAVHVILARFGEDDEQRLAFIEDTET